MVFCLEVYLDKKLIRLYSIAVVITTPRQEEETVLAIPLSVLDQQLAEEFYRKNILRELMLDSLANAIVITDSQCPNPSITTDMDTPAGYTIVNFGGALLFHSENVLYPGAEEAAQFMRAQVKLVAHSMKEIVLVAYAPSLAINESDFTLGQVIAALLQVERELKESFGAMKKLRHLKYHSFLCVKFTDGREYAYEIDVAKFNIWYREYEQNALGRGDDDDDDPEPTLRLVHPLDGPAD